MYFTSAGLLVRHGNNNFSDGGGPQRFSLVTPDGIEKPLSVVTEESVPGVDPRQPYLAYTVVERGTVHLLVHDVTTDEKVADVTVPGDLTWGGWSGPPVALAGDTAYVGTDKVTYAVDWRTGEVGTTRARAPGLPGHPGRAGGRRHEDRGLGAGRRHREDAPGPAARRRDGLPGPVARRPVRDDGRHRRQVLRRVRRRHGQPRDARRRASYDYGWTPDGDLFTVKGHHVVTCSTATADCSTGSETIPTDGGGVSPEDVRFAGRGLRVLSETPVTGHGRRP